MRIMKKIILLILMAILLNGCAESTTTNKDKLLISAASSLTEVMVKVEEEFHNMHPEIEIVFNYGSSSNLRNQIEQGAPVDIFLSASQKDMKVLIDGQLILEKSVSSFAGNSLVLASTTPLAESKSLSELLHDTDGSIAVGEPETVPLGRYTKQALIEAGLWEALEGKLIYAKNARQVLTYVESENVSLGIIYSSDASISSKVLEIMELPRNMQAIVYPGGIAVNSENRDAAEAFIAFIIADKSQQIFKEFGFIPVKGEMP